MADDAPEKKIRRVVDDCADCDVCRFLMDADCQFFPELYRLWDQERESGRPIGGAELRRLVDLCNFCALCPCPNIRADIIEAKTRFIDRDGLAFGVRTLEDVARMARLCGAFPALSRRLLRGRLSAAAIKRAAGIHPDRRLPAFAAESFPRRAELRGLTRPAAGAAGTRVAYFAGCTANYLFPEVAEATVALLAACGVEVHFPPQQCCGMPSMLEGDRRTTLEFARANLAELARLAAEGYDIVCSCPTCGFMLREVLGQGAYYSADYQQSVGGGGETMKIPDGRPAGQGQPARLVEAKLYKGLFRDDGYFSALPALERIRVAESTRDLGEYLLELQAKGALAPMGAAPAGPMVYFPPCHQREQNIGRPWAELLAGLEGIELAALDGAMDCCGMAGIMGFKRDFHPTSVQLGQRLLDKIRRLAPARIVTDCLSCRLQFQQLLPYPVSHPVEILRSAVTPA